MTEFTYLLAISALLLAYVFFLMYVSKLTNDLLDQIATGFVRGHPLSIEERWFILYARATFYVLAAAMTPLFLAVAAAMLAKHAGGADSRFLANIAAFLFATSSSIWFIIGYLQFFNYRRLLRQAEAEAD